jgi:hypothetical protein
VLFVVLVLVLLLPAALADTAPGWLPLLLLLLQSVVATTRVCSSGQHDPVVVVVVVAIILVMIVKVANGQKDTLAIHVGGSARALLPMLPRCAALRRAASMVMIPCKVH